MPANCECGRPIPAQQGRARPRKWCETCRPPRNRPNPRLLAVPDQPDAARVVDLRQPTVEADPLSLEAATLAALRPVDRNSTTHGIAALKLARLVDAGGYNAQGAAALVKAHREALDVALEGTTPTADVIDAIFGASG